MRLPKEKVCVLCVCVPILGFLCLLWRRRVEGLCSVDQGVAARQLVIQAAIDLLLMF